MATQTIPIVFVHGTGCNSAIWHNQLEYLGARYRPLALDLPGHGQAGGEPQPSVDYYADALGSFVAEQHADRPVLAGQSLGGAVILTAALRNPSAYRGLVLVGTGARLRVLPALIEQMRSDFPAGLDQLEAAEWAAGTAPELRARYRRMAEEMGSLACWCDFVACDKFDVSARLGELSMPAIAIVGAEDKLTPVKYSEYFRQHMPSCSLAVVPGAGHMVQVEQPQAVNQAIEAFLDKIDS